MAAGKDGPKWRVVRLPDAGREDMTTAAQRKRDKARRQRRRVQIARMDESPETPGLHDRHGNLKDTFSPPEETFRLAQEDAHHEFRDRDAYEHGMIAHRGVLTSWEEAWLDWDRVREELAERLGSTPADLEVLYGRRRLTKEQIRRRDRIDDRLLALQERGTKMAILAKYLGWKVRADGWSERMHSALKRARSRRA